MVLSRSRPKDREKQFVDGPEAIHEPMI